MTKKRTWIIATLVSLLVARLGVNLDGPSDKQAEWDQSQALLDAQREAAQADRLLRAAQAVCAEKRGPQAEARFDEDGRLVCVASRGKPLQVGGSV